MKIKEDKMKKSRNSLSILAVVTMLAGFIIAPFVLAAVGVDSTALRNAVTAENIREHLVQLEAIGPRVSGTPGYDIAAAHYANLLQGAGYDVTTQEFEYDLWEELSDPVLEQISPDPKVYPPYDPAGFATMEYSGSARLILPVQISPTRLLLLNAVYAIFPSKP
jgi:hypothetical protein